MTYLRNILVLALMKVLVFHGILSGLINFSKLATDASMPLYTSLKPLTPIAGTNLLLNTPYKWHDHTKPGCFVTWLEENEKKELTMLCNKDDQQLYNTPNASWIFERYTGEESTEEYSKSLLIRNVACGHSPVFTFDAEFVLGPPETLFKIPTYVGNGRYTIHSDPSNKSHLQVRYDERLLTQLQLPNHRAKFAIGNKEGGDFPYSFASSIHLAAKMYNFEFTRPLDDQMSILTSKKDLIDSYEINNPSPVTLSRKVTVSEKVTNEFSWGLSESFKAMSSVTGSAGIPFIGSVEMTFEIETGLESQQEWKNSVEKTFELSYDVSVPPQTKATISAWYERVNGVSMEYTAQTEITGKTSRITIFDDIVDDLPATGEMIRRQLSNVNFDGKIVEIKEYSVITQIKGTMVASAGVRGQLNVNGETVQGAALPK